MKVRVQEWGYGRELTSPSDDDMVNVRLIFDRRNKAFVVRKSDLNQSKSHKELIFYDWVIIFSEW